jgi:hypothetical protein
MQGVESAKDTAEGIELPRWNIEKKAKYKATLVEVLYLIIIYISLLDTIFIKSKIITKSK